MTKEHRTLLTVEQLLEDDQFIKAVFQGRSSVKSYQEEHLRQYGDVTELVEEARLAVLSMQQYFKSQSPPQKTLATILERIRSS